MISAAPARIFSNDDVHRWIGGEVTGSLGFKASQFQLTDNERQLRDLAYPRIEPPHSGPAWRSVFGEYAALSSPWRQQVAFDRTAYGRSLIDEPHRSHSSRYSQLIDDVRDDISRFEPFFASAVRVIDFDRKRNMVQAFIACPVADPCSRRLGAPLRLNRARKHSSRPTKKCPLCRAFVPCWLNSFFD